MVITVAICFLVACVVVSALILLGVFKSEEEKSVADASTNYGVTAPCVDSKAKAPGYTSITVRVLNGTDKSGIARAVSKSLNYRGFAIQGASDFTENDLARTEIRFGKNGVAQAYTVYAQFNDAILRMDNRTDKLVDVVIGNSFYDLNKTEEVSVTKGATLKSLKGCVSASKLAKSKKLPAAVKHDAVK
jgi:hypothetical protein